MQAVLVHALVLSWVDFCVSLLMDTVNKASEKTLNSVIRFTDGLCEDAIIPGADPGFFRVLEHPFPGMGPISYDYGLI